MADAPDEDRSEDEVAALAFIADPAVLASIFAAPERLAVAPVDSAQPGASSATAPDLAPKPEQIAQNPAPSAKPELAANAAALTLAQAAVIELDPEAKPVLPQETADSIAPAANVAAQLQARPCDWTLNTCPD